MKKIIYGLAIVFSLATSGQQAFANDRKAPAKELSAGEKLELANITKRVEEIRNMDKSNLSRLEKKALRKELKEMKKRADFLSDRVSLSVGAIIIILLLLIIIF